MARNTGPKKKMLRRFGMIEEETPSFRSRPRRKSDYGKRLEQKQKLKFIYDIKEKQFRRYIEIAKKTPGDPGKTLISQLERRLDNVIYRLGFALTRPEARQIVSHGHVLVSGRRVNIPSYSVQPGEEIVLKDRMYNNSQVQESLKFKKPPSWLRREKNKGLALSLPPQEELRQDVNISYVLELYS